MIVIFFFFAKMMVKFIMHVKWGNSIFKVLNKFPSNGISLSASHNGPIHTPKCKWTIRQYASMKSKIKINLEVSLWIFGNSFDYDCCPWMGRKRTIKKVIDWWTNPFGNIKEHVSLICLVKNKPMSFFFAIKNKPMSYLLVFASLSISIT